MNLYPSPNRLVGALLAWGAAGASAHDGHGLSGGHWHVSDAWGFVAFAAVLAVAAWMSRGDR